MDVDYLEYFSEISWIEEVFVRFAWNANGGIYMRQKNVGTLRYI